MKITIENKSKNSIHGLKSGGKREIDADEKGTPFDLHWRRRLKDSKIDGAIVVSKEIKKTKTLKEDKD